MYAYAATLMEGEVRLAGGEHGILPVTRGGWRDGMNSLPYHPPAGGRDPPVKRSQHPALEHGVSGGGAENLPGTTTRGCRRDSSMNLWTPESTITWTRGPEATGNNPGSSFTQILI